MRLIDADALIEKMKKVETDYEDAMTRPSWWTAYSVISEQPTAYDVEKVAAELKEANKNEVNAGMCPNGFIHCLTAIDIVKRGGVK